MTKTKARKYMEMAVKVMKSTKQEKRDDGKISPLVGVVLVSQSGEVYSAYRGELGKGEHAEYTLLMRKLENVDIAGSTLFVTLEPCAPGARHYPKKSCAQWIANRNISSVYVGFIDPDPTVANQGIKYLEDNGVKICMFDKDIQDKIYEINKEFFMQAEERASLANKTSVKQTIIDKSNIIVDENLLDKEAIEYYCKLSNISQTDFLERLSNIGLIEDNKFNNQALILFGKNPADRFTQVGIKIKKTIGDKTTFFAYENAVVLAVAKIKEWYETNMPYVSNRDNLVRTNVYIFPFDELLREALVNAIVHRDYDIEGSLIVIEITENEIVIKSPGDPVNGITFEQIKTFSAPSRARNPKMAFVFNRMNLMERSGWGMDTFKNITKNFSNLPKPVYYMDGVNICLKFFISNEAKDLYLEETVYGNLNKDEIEGYKYIKSIGRITKEGYREKFAYDNSKVKRHLAKMQKFELIELKGSGTNSYYLSTY